MFWLSTSPYAQARSPQPKPWYRLGLLGFLLLLFLVVWLSLPSKNKANKDALEAIQCYYLKHDHTFLPERILYAIPGDMTKYYQKKARPIAIDFQASSSARSLAKKYEEEENNKHKNKKKGEKSIEELFKSEASDKKDKTGQTCLDKARESGQLSIKPQRRIFLAMLKLSTEEYKAQQKHLENLVTKYEQTLLEHPWYGWGLLPSNKRWVGLFTSFWLQTGWFSILWQLLILWIFVGSLEQRWQGLAWLTTFVVCGFLGNIPLWFLVKGNIPVLGSGAAVAGVMGAWTFCYMLKSMHFAIAPPLTQWKKEFVIPGWSPVVLWFMFELLDSTVVNAYPISVFAIHMAIFGLSLGLFLGLQRLDYLTADGRWTFGLSEIREQVQGVGHQFKEVGHQFKEVGQHIRESIPERKRKKKKEEEAAQRTPPPASNNVVPTFGARGPSSIPEDVPEDPMVTSRLSGLKAEPSKEFSKTFDPGTPPSPPQGGGEVLQQPSDDWGWSSAELPQPQKQNETEQTKPVSVDWDIWDDEDSSKE